MAKPPNPRSTWITSTAEETVIVKLPYPGRCARTLHPMVVGQGKTSHRDITSIATQTFGLGRAPRIVTSRLVTPMTGTQAAIRAQLVPVIPL